MPQLPSEPEMVVVKSKDGSSVSVQISTPNENDNNIIESYRIDYSLKEFINEKQRIALICNSRLEVQTVTTSASNVNKRQYLILDSAYQNNGIVFEIQKVVCSANGRIFGLSFGGKTAFIDCGADKFAIKSALESLPNINKVSVSFNGNILTICNLYNEYLDGNFFVTFPSVVKIAKKLLTKLYLLRV